jgi:predicted esterase
MKTSFHHVSRTLLLFGGLATGLLAPHVARAAAAPGQDLRLSYRSAIDDTDQPYRIYIPTQYNADRTWPLIVAMHGTGGTEATLFDGYENDGAIKKAAEANGALLVSPLGRGVTEFRGIGENDIFCVLEDVAKRYRVDPTRIYLTGHSMGGTGAAYLALHHPDRFAAAAPLAAAYSFPWLARNAATVPFLWVSGAKDSDFYLRGVLAGMDRMLKFGVPATLEVLPGEGHSGPVQDFNRVFAWLVAHQRNPHPKSYFFEVDTPLHGRAWWTAVEKIAAPGRMASVRAEAVGKNAVRLELENVAELSFVPDPVVFDVGQSIAMTIADTVVAEKIIPAGQQLRLSGGPGQWRAELQPARPEALTVYRRFPVAEAPETIDMLGTEKRLANWITDAMRAATQADIALYNPVYYRGLPIPKGRVDIVDIIQCSRPFDEELVTLRLTGREILTLLENNLPNPNGKREPALAVNREGAGPIVQVSGLRYKYDLKQPVGKRVVECTLDPARTYTVVMEGQVTARNTLQLGKLFKNVAYTTTPIGFTTALYGHAARTGVINPARASRVEEVR